MTGENELHKILEGPAEQVAQRLLGCYLVRDFEQGKQAVCRIVETEAYHQADAASHSYKGRTPRTDVMFGPPGYLYVYFTYGMHYCCNVVTGPEGEGSAVLLRALEPITGVELLRERRPAKADSELTNGPAKLCQALDISRAFNGHNLSEAPIRLELRPEIPQESIVQTTRIGISRAQDVPWRFYLKNNSFVSKM